MNTPSKTNTLPQEGTHSPRFVSEHARIMDELFDLPYGGESGGCTRLNLDAFSIGAGIYTIDKAAHLLMADF